MGDGLKKVLKNPVHLFPALMLIPGYETKYMDMKNKETRYVDAVYADKKAELQLGTVIWYYKHRKGAFQKEHGSTMSEPVVVKGVHKYTYQTGSTRRRGCKSTRTGASYELEGVVSRFMPYELEIVKSDKSKTPKIRNQEDIRKTIRKNKLLLI